MKAACDLCGTVPPTSTDSDASGEGDGEAVPLTWSTSVEHGVRHSYCERCSRENVRSIEAKLDPEWW